MAVVSVAACGSTGGNTTGGGSGQVCIPGTSISCACVGGLTSAQVCKDDGKGYDACQCGSSSSSSGTGGAASSSSSSGSMGTCGDGIQQPSDHCDNPSSEFYCKLDCANMGTGGTGGSMGTGGSCAGHVYYAGKFDGAGPVWANLPAAGGMTSIDAGNAQCKALNIGADHVCDYEEVLKAQAQNELAAIPQGTSAWIQRTTVAMVNGNPSQPGPGGRCNNWTYQTNHISDGEYISFDQVGVPTYHLDNDTVFNPNNPGVHTLTDLQCGGTMRSILCCYQACN
ncbi:MAG: hypothetical protein QM820_48190 [Minicystis sp.]